MKYKKSNVEGKIKRQIWQGKDDDKNGKGRRHIEWKTGTEMENWSRWENKDGDKWGEGRGKGDG